MATTEKSPIRDETYFGNPDAPIEDEHLDKFLPRKTDETFDAGTDAEKGFDSKWCYYKQVLAVGLGWMFLFMAVLTLRNLQSSMNHREGLGLITMGSFYGGMMIGSFMSSAIVQTLGPKITLSVSAVFHVTFVAANFYPSLPLLATVAAVAGVSHSSLWAAQSTYITALAKSFCKKFQASYENILARFFGLAFLFTELSTVLGNPLASLLLSLESTIESGNSSVANGLEVFVSQNSSYNDINSHRNHESSLLYQNSSLRQMHCGRHYCHSFNSDNSKMEITAWTRFVVVGVFTATAALALIIFIVTIKDRHIYSRKPGCSDLPRKLTGTLQSILDIKMVLCIPLITFFGFQMAFVSGDVVKAYITCSMGIQQVGNLMLFYGILDAFSAIAAGWLMKWVGSFVIFTSGK
ncbi:protein unc-93 homolog A-like [Liolophura sinensis]|uniref:protein unc-93 homolog A-like n=1 Tax=Liolophura sinensis TaxID=3198878 RepID=UPI0031581A47